ncbi:MAG: hypothetical protein ACMVY4_01950 [Minwuia sp.]|uniref:hypothetical protein n=1 Tax=Minwuia sp. TaxID=2493630 RepID=UPI003A8965F6
MSGSTGPLSLGEIRFRVTRAIVGAGAPFAVAEPVAQAVASMAAGGEDPIPALAAALERLHRAEAGMRPALVDDGLTDLDGKPLSCLFAGPALADLNLTAEAGSLDDRGLAAAIASAIRTGVLPAPPEDGVRVDETAWRTVGRFFDRCLVPSTDASRTTGAGAGLRDDD